MLLTVFKIISLLNLILEFSNIFYWVIIVLLNENSFVELNVLYFEELKFLLNEKEFCYKMIVYQLIKKNTYKMEGN